MTALTPLQRTSEFSHYVRVFFGRLLAGTTRGDPLRPQDHTYAIQSNVRPEKESWEPTATVPLVLQGHAERLMKSLDEGQEIENLPEIGRHFREMASTLVQAQRYLEKVPESDQPRFIKEYVDGAVPVVQRTAARIEQALTAEIV